MASVWIPSLLRDLTGGVQEITVAASTVNELVDLLEVKFPGIRDRLCDEGRMRPNITVVVDGRRSPKGLRQTLETTSEVHFVPAISGGCDLKVTDNSAVPVTLP